MWPFTLCLLRVSLMQYPVRGGAQRPSLEWGRCGPTFFARRVTRRSPAGASMLEAVIVAGANIPHRLEGLAAEVRRKYPRSNIAPLETLGSS